MTQLRVTQPGDERVLAVLDCPTPADAGGVIEANRGRLTGVFGNPETRVAFGHTDESGQFVMHDIVYHGQPLGV